MSSTHNVLLLQKIHCLATSLLDESWKLEDLSATSITDSLAISCANYRGKDSWLKTGKISVREEDHRQAQTIRSYYRGKLMTLVLKNYPLTEFRKDLTEYLESNSESNSEKYSGMVYRLPEMYELDSLVDQTVQRFEANTESFNNSVTMLHNKTVSLCPAFKFTRSAGKLRFKSNLYWLWDQQSNRLVNFRVRTDSQLLGVWDSLWDKHKLTSLNIRCDLYQSYLDDLHFYQITNIREVFL